MHFGLGECILHCWWTFGGIKYTAPCRQIIAFPQSLSKTDHFSAVRIYPWLAFVVGLCCGYGRSSNFGEYFCDLIHESKGVCGWTTHPRCESPSMVLIDQSVFVALCTVRSFLLVKRFLSLSKRLNSYQVLIKQFLRFLPNTNLWHPQLWHNLMLNAAALYTVSAIELFIYFYW